MSFGDVTVAVLGREQLIKNKLAAARDKDLLDAKALARAAPEAPHDRLVDELDAESAPAKAKRGP